MELRIRKFCWPACVRVAVLLEGLDDFVVTGDDDRRLGVPDGESELSDKQRVSKEISHIVLLVSACKAGCNAPHTRTRDRDGPA